MIRLNSEIHSPVSATAAGRMHAKPAGAPRARAVRLRVRAGEHEPAGEAASTHPALNDFISRCAEVPTSPQLAHRLVDHVDLLPDQRCRATAGTVLSERLSACGQASLLEALQRKLHVHALVEHARAGRAEAADELFAAAAAAASAPHVHAAVRRLHDLPHSPERALLRQYDAKLLELVARGELRVNDPRYHDLLAALLQPHRFEAACVAAHADGEIARFLIERWPSVCAAGHEPKLHAVLAAAVQPHPEMRERFDRLLLWRVALRKLELIGRAEGRPDARALVHACALLYERSRTPADRYALRLALRHTRSYDARIVLAETTHLHDDTIDQVHERAALLRDGRDDCAPGLQHMIKPRIRANQLYATLASTTSRLPRADLRLAEREAIFAEAARYGSAAELHEVLRILAVSTSTVEPLAERIVHRQMLIRHASADPIVAPHIMARRLGASSYLDGTAEGGDALTLIKLARTNALLHDDPSAWSSELQSLHRKNFGNAQLRRAVGEAIDRKPVAPAPPLERLAHAEIIAAVAVMPNQAFEKVRIDRDYDDEDDIARFLADH